MVREEQINKQVGDQIRKVRLSRGVSQDKLGVLSGLHRSHVGQVERGESNVTLKTLFQVSRALEVKLVGLLKGIK